MSRKTIVNAILVLAAVFMVSGAVGLATPAKADAVSLPTHIVAADRADECARKAGSFFGLKPWYYYMGDELGVKSGAASDRCGIRCFNIFVQKSPNDCGQTKSDIPGIVLVIIDDLLRIAGLAAIAMMFVGAFQYVASRGNSERSASAQSTIIAALTGLAVSLVAVALVSFLGSQLR